MDDEKERFRKFNAEVEQALEDAITKTIQPMAAKYQLDEAFTNLAMAAASIRAGISMVLTTAGRTPAEIDAMLQHVVFMLRGAAQDPRPPIQGDEGRGSGNPFQKN
jgi:hypothetical protein